MSENTNFNNYDILLKKVIWIYKQDISNPWELKTYNNTPDENVYELMYISRGSFKSVSEFGEEIFGSGEIVLGQNKNTVKPYVNSSDKLPFTYYSIIFSTFEPIQLKSDNKKYHSVISKFSKDIEIQFIKAFNIFIEKPIWYNLDLKSILNDVLKEYFVAELKAEERRNIPKYIRTCINYIYSNAFKEHINITNLAAEHHVSLGHFIREFKKYVGFSPNQYILNLRLSRSCELLKFTNQPINEIAENCGFDNISYFNRIFKERYNETPSSYRGDHINEYF